MQMKRDGYLGAYGAETSWIDGMKDPGYVSMKHLKNLMLAFPFYVRHARPECDFQNQWRTV